LNNFGTEWPRNHVPNSLKIRHGTPPQSLAEAILCILIATASCLSDGRNRLENNEKVAALGTEPTGLSVRFRHSVSTAEQDAHRHSELNRHQTFPKLNSVLTSF
jgi:hypothetical protein